MGSETYPSDDLHGSEGEKFKCIRHLKGGKDCEGVDLVLNNVRSRNSCFVQKSFLTSKFLKFYSGQ
jgi:hypothetical protein